MASFNNGNHVWWNGIYLPSGAKGEGSQIDHYLTYDRDQSSYGQRIVDARWRSMETRNETKSGCFAPSKMDLKYGRKALKPARETRQNSPMCFKLDPYGARGSRSFVGIDRSRRQEFSRNPGDRFHMAKPMGKDYTKTGWSTNTIKPEGMPSAFRRSASLSIMNRTV